MIELLNMDCMDYLRDQPDKSFDLAIVDPPYGIGAGEFAGFDKVKRGNGSIGYTNRKAHDPKGWDLRPPKKVYFNELERVAKDRIIWGGNYFDLPPTRGIICWDKCQSFENFSAWEMAWTSYDKVAKLFKYDNKGFMNKDGAAIHPTQKPVKLYQWVLKNYAEPNQRILDTHLGSGSSAIAAHYFGVDFVGIEIDEDYYNAACKRFNNETRQIALI